MAFILSCKTKLVFPFPQKVTKAQEQILPFIIRQFKMFLGIFQELFRNVPYMWSVPLKRKLFSCTFQLLNALYEMQAYQL